MKCAILLDFSEPQKKYLKLSYTVTGVSRPELVFTFPTWSPGSYLIKEYQNQVSAVTFTDAKGRGLKFEKINKCQWKVLSKSSTVKLTYRVYAGELSVRGAYADHELVHINPAAAFFYITDERPRRLTLRLKVPQPWDVALAKREQRGGYVFANFAELYDTPILSGALRHETFTAGRVRYRLSFWGQAMVSDRVIARDVHKLVVSSTKAFGHNPCQEYLFLVIFVPNVYGGLEHSFCSANFFDGMKLENKKEYTRFLSLLAHEHFHLWVVKRIRPVELSAYDLTREIYTKDLWLAEGVTSFYDDHLLLRSGLVAEKKYLEIVAENINKIVLNKAAKVMSLSESSFDAWIKFYRPNENSLNTVLSYYVMGGLITLIMDLKILKATRGKKSFDDVLRALYALYKTRPERGISRQEFLAIARQVTGVDFAPFFKRHVDSVAPISWKRELAPFGIAVGREGKNKNYYLGLVLKTDQGRVLIQNIAEDSPAYASVLQAEDEVLAINGERMVSAQQLDKHLRETRLRVLFSRLGRVSETRLVLTERARKEISLKIKDRLNPKQKRLIRKFLRKPAF